MAAGIDEQFELVVDPMTGDMVCSGVGGRAPCSPTHPELSETIWSLTLVVD
jgi:hypothetical protein